MVIFTEASIILQTPEARGAQGLGSQGLHLEVVNSTPLYLVVMCAFIKYSCTVSSYPSTGKTVRSNLVKLASSSPVSPHLLGVL